MEYVIRPEEAGPQSPVGGKARALAVLGRTGIPVPRWFALAPAAFHASLDAEQCDILEGADAEKIRAVIEKVQPCAAVCGELQAALGELCPGGEPAAVRSSAEEEDGALHSFAGQLESFLSVAPDGVCARVAAVWRSAFSERVVAYRREHHLPLPPPAPGVLIQRMVQADAAGIAFGADPVSGREDVAVVSAIRGLGTALVSGQCSADTYHVALDGNITQRSIADASVLNDDQVRQVAELVRRAGQVFGRPQDVEWAIEAGRLYLLQSRPITTLTACSAPEELATLWDNSNIAESYNGVTTPLTFSFARRAYEHVYRQFCRMLRVPEAKLAENDDVFGHMLGLIRGRVYYNLMSWYRALALLPGFTFNRRFMEQMMGVRAGLPDSIAAKLGQATRWQRWKDAWHFLGSAFALVRGHFTLAKRTRRFYERLNRALGTYPIELDRLSMHELVAYYRGLEQQLLPRWDAPLLNDFLAMIFYGILRRLTEKWCEPDGGTLHNDLLCGEGGIISAEPALRLRELAEIARKDAALTAALCGAPLPEILRLVEGAPAFRALLQGYLDKFGDRCLEELKLESPTLHDDPLMLLRSVGRLAERLARQQASPPSQEGERRRQAERRGQAALGRRPLRRVLFGWVLANARARLRDRENLRFERTRLFGRARRIFLEFGRRFHALDVLSEPRDIFYLEVDEILGFIAGTVTCADLRGLARVRKLEFDHYRQTPAPPDRFETRGPVSHDSALQAVAASAVGGAPSINGDCRHGLGCSPGVVRGPARVVTDPRTTAVRDNEVIVARRTDPGWVTLFATAAALVVEHGSPLSHSAIVARELGLAMVTAVEGVTDWLHDGDWVEVDGSRGTVTRIA